MQPLTPEQCFAASQLAAQTSSPDNIRAAWQLLSINQHAAEIQLRVIIDNVKRQLLAELTRLTNRELQTYHVTMALSRVQRIFDVAKKQVEGLISTLTRAQYTRGRLASRIKSRRKAADAYVYNYTDNKRLARIISQLTGRYYNALDGAADNTRRQILHACARANMPVGADIQPTPPAYTSIAEGVSAPRGAAPLDVEVSKEQREQLTHAPLRAARAARRQARRELRRTAAQYVIGRREMDVIRRKTLQSIARNTASGAGLIDASAELTRDILSEGITSFVDRSGRRWELANYCAMTTRTTSRQAINIGELYDDPDHDLYMVVNRGSTCPVCARYEGRVYSRSGKSKHYPPLAEIYGQIDKSQPKSLDNSYLTIHPNCRHTLTRYTERGRSTAEIEAMRRKSSFTSNPLNIDPRKQADIEQYQETERQQGIHNAALRQYRRMLQLISAQTLGNFLQYKKHYIAKDDKYRHYLKLYNERKGNI